MVWLEEVVDGAVEARFGCDRKRGTWTCDWGTLTGALCFAVGGVMQGFDRPAPNTP